MCTLLSLLAELPIVSPCEAMSKAAGPEELVLVLGDQLDACSAAFTHFDAENRESFGKSGPGHRHPQPMRFPPDAITREVIALVKKRFEKHPGTLDDFDWPVTPADAERALNDFVAYRLSGFGRWQDAMWSNKPWLFHSRLSAAMNLKLLDPRRVIATSFLSFDPRRNIVVGCSFVS